MAFSLSNRHFFSFWWLLALILCLSVGIKAPQRPQLCCFTCRGRILAASMSPLRRDWWPVASALEMVFLVAFYCLLFLSLSSKTLFGKETVFWIFLKELLLAQDVRFAKVSIWTRSPKIQWFWPLVTSTSGSKPCTMQQAMLPPRVWRHCWEPLWLKVSMAWPPSYFWTLSEIFASGKSRGAKRLFRICIMGKRSNKPSNCY